MAEAWDGLGVERPAYLRDPICHKCAWNMAFDVPAQPCVPFDSMPRLFASCSLAPPGFLAN